MPVLIVEDDGLVAEMLQNALEVMGYQTAIATNGRQGLRLLRTGAFRIVVSDWEMPELSGPDMCREIRRQRLGGYVYVILLTSRTGTESLVEGFDAGADDFITKPFHPKELKARIRAGERLLALESRDLTIFALAKLAETRDTDTGLHLERIREYCQVLADEISSWEKYQAVVDGDFIQLLYQTSPLHDIGKVGIEDRVLLKPGKLTPEEFEIMKQHTSLGGQTLESLACRYPEAHFLQMAADIALTHHERYDGTGYPHGLAGEAIPLCGRITAVADVYDAVTTKRVYKPALSHQAAKELIVQGRGTQFDPDMVDAFLAREAEFDEIRRAQADCCKAPQPQPQPQPMPCLLPRTECFGSVLTTA